MGVSFHSSVVHGNIQSVQPSRPLHDDDAQILPSSPPLERRPRHPALDHVAQGMLVRTRLAGGAGPARDGVCHLGAARGDARDGLAVFEVWWDESVSSVLS